MHWNLALLFTDHRRDPERAIRHFERYLELGGEDRMRVTRWIGQLQRELENEG